MGNRAGSGARGSIMSQSGAPTTWLGQQQQTNRKAYNALTAGQKKVFDYIVGRGANGKEVLANLKKYYDDAARMAGPGASPKEIYEFIHASIMSNY